MRISDLVQDHRETAWDNEHWVTDGTTVWQVVNDKRNGFRYSVYVDGEIKGYELFESPLLFTCWLADKQTYIGPCRYGGEPT